MALGAWIAVALQILVETSSFWLESERGVRYLAIGVGLLPGGLLLPLEFFPGWAQTLFLWTPFPHSLYVPARIWLDGTPSPGLVGVLAAQLAWVLLLTFAARVAVIRGGRRLQVHGG